MIPMNNTDIITAPAHPARSLPTGSFVILTTPVTRHRIYARIVLNDADGLTVDDGEQWSVLSDRQLVEFDVLPA